MVAWGNLRSTTTFLWARWRVCGQLTSTELCVVFTKGLSIKSASCLASVPNEKQRAVTALTWLVGWSLDFVRVVIRCFARLAAFLFWVCSFCDFHVFVYYICYLPVLTAFDWLGWLMIDRFNFWQVNPVSKYFPAPKVLHVKTGAKLDSWPVDTLQGVVTDSSPERNGQRSRAEKHRSKRCSTNRQTAAIHIILHIILHQPHSTLLQHVCMTPWRSSPASRRCGFWSLWRCRSSPRRWSPPCSPPQPETVGGVSWSVYSWLVGQFYSWLVGQFYSWLVGQFYSWLVGQFYSWSVGQFYSWSVGQFYSWLVSRLVVQCYSWLASCPVL